jgi:hypothetical protein
MAKPMIEMSDELRRVVESDPEYRVGSAAAVLRAMREPPHLKASDVDELDAAISAGQLPVQSSDPFSNESAS